MTLLIKHKNSGYKMIYQPIKENEKRQWLDKLWFWASVLDGKTEFTAQNEIFEIPEGDISAAKDIVGKFLATLSGKPVKID
jgi:hypothetical protein